MTIRACVFDAYGTLFDVAAAARAAATEPAFPALEACWPRLATEWRDRQLDYTWLRAVAGRHADFWAVTCDALDWALEATGLDGDAALRDRLRALYRELDAFPEVPALLADLKARGLACAILSNGTPDMLASAVASAGIGGHLDAILSVEEVGIFKPHDRVYALAETRLDLPREAILFVSSNGWDAAGAAGFGFRTLWVNRAGAPLDRLFARPHHVLPDLTRLPEVL